MAKGNKRSTALNQGWRQERKYLKKVCCEYNARVSWRTLDYEEPVLAEWDPAALIVNKQLSNDEEEARADRVKILNARIRRWFTNRLRKINKQCSSALDPTKDPYAVLLAKLSGLTAPPKACQAYQQVKGVGLIWVLFLFNHSLHMAIVQKQGDNRIRTCEPQQPIRSGWGWHSQIIYRNLESIPVHSLVWCKCDTQAQFLGLMPLILRAALSLRRIKQV
ncbi:hypothetical protein B0H14DRAFT_2648498 [Mycena olivaceomarginata]|nr:hypothetical protein B0H14DRAFT_2648498 [Mycena olivaceomarginata]